MPEQTTTSTMTTPLCPGDIICEGDCLYLLPSNTHDQESVSRTQTRQAYLGSGSEMGWVLKLFFIHYFQ